MADQNNKWEENAPGSFYVDNQCVACGSCVSEAPDCFELNVDENHAFVKKQPESTNEEKDCRNAMKACPVDAIGDDGEED